MANTGIDTEMAYVAEAMHPVVDPVEQARRKGSVISEKHMHMLTEAVANSESDEDDEPTEEELATLRRISGKIPWQVFTVGLVEFCERFSYYGATVVFTNFIQRPRPSPSGAIALSTHPDDFTTSGGLGRGQRTAFGLTTFNTFWSYFMPLVGGYVADVYLGRFNTIQWSILFAIVGHIILVISAIPPVLDNPSGAMGAFAVGLVIMGVGTGGFKSNIAPLIGEQVRDRKKKVITLPSGERVIRDPIITVSRIYMWFYFLINSGSLVGQISMSFAEKYVGFWLSFTLPTALFLIAPLILVACKKKYVKLPPTGSVLVNGMKVWALAMKPCWSLNPVAFVNNIRDKNFWERVKPSNLGENKPAWLVGDDEWVDQVRRGFQACKVFTFYPLYWLAYNQMISNLTSQSAILELGGVPSDIITNLNPLSLLIFIPLFDLFIYPALRKLGIKFTPIKRITLGFFLASMAMIAACVIQYYAYKLGPCGNQMNTCKNPAPFTVWVQAVPYVFIGFSEVMASITGLEYAFTKAPENMRSLVQGVYLFQNAFSSAIGQAFTSISDDPYLVENYGIVAGLAAFGGVTFWLCFHKLDKEEDALNMLNDTAYKGKIRPLDDPERNSIRSRSVGSAAHAEEKL